jgi:hypothetical protein
MEEGDEGRSVSDLAGDGRDPAEKEEIVDGVGDARSRVALGRGLAADDGELVDAVIGRPVSRTLET